jgi:FCD domain
MPLPQQQLQRLSVDMQNHERELQDLEANPHKNDPSVQAEIEFHQTILRVGRNEKLLASLGEIYDNPNLIDQLASNPDAFLQSRGIQLPSGATKIVASKPTPQSAVAAINFHIARFHFSLEWSTQSGFTIRQLSPDA